MLVEGAWFDEFGVLSELSGVTDDATGELFEHVRGAAPQLDAVWRTSSARRQPWNPGEHHASHCDRLFTTALEEVEDRNRHMAKPAEARQADSELPVPGTELPEAKEMVQEELDRFVSPGMTHIEHVRRRE